MLITINVVKFWKFKLQNVIKCLAVAGTKSMLTNGQSIFHKIALLFGLSKKVPLKTLVLNAKTLTTIFPHDQCTKQDVGAYLPPFPAPNQFLDDTIRQKNPS